MLFGSKCHNCGCAGPLPCNSCNEAGEDLLPDAIKLSFSNVPDRIQSRSFVTVKAEPSCMGAGAAGEALLPIVEEGDPGGSLGTIAVTLAGAGYARLGRITPDVVLSVQTAGGSGADVRGKFGAPTQNACGCDDLWQITGVDIVDGGEGYADLEYAYFTAATSATKLSGAMTGRIRVQKSAPTLTLSATPGSGAAFSVSYTKYEFQNVLLQKDYAWTISGVSVTQGGSGYSDNAQLTVALGTDNVQLEAASLTLRTQRQQPTVSLSIPSMTGSGAVLQAQFEQTTVPAGDTVWQLRGDTISIQQAGSGYSVNDEVVATVTSGTTQPGYGNFSGYVSKVSGTGGVLEIAHNQVGTYFGDTGSAASVAVDYNGGFYGTPGVIVGVDLLDTSTAYQETASVPPCVATPTVTIEQEPSVSNGSGAVVSAVIDDDPTSETFGQVTGFDVDEGGEDYIARWWVRNECCAGVLESQEFVLARRSTIGGFTCTYGNGLCVGNDMSVTFRGVNQSVEVSWGWDYGFGPQRCESVTSSVAASDCLVSPLSIEAVDGTLISIQAGGDPLADKGRNRKPDFATITVAWGGFSRTHVANPPPGDGISILQPGIGWTLSVTDSWGTVGATSASATFLLELIYQCPCFYRVQMFLTDLNYQTITNPSPPPGAPPTSRLSRVIAWAGEATSGNDAPTFGDFNHPAALLRFRKTFFKVFLNWNPTFGTFSLEANMLLPFSQQDSATQAEWLLYQSWGLLPPFEQVANAPDPGTSWTVGWN